MKTSTSTLLQNNLESGMMKLLALSVSALLLVGCDGYQVELDPAWQGDPTQTVEPSTDEPTDTEPPVIILSDPTDTSDPSGADICDSIVCPEIGPYCFDSAAIECCTPCDAGLRICHPDSPVNFHDYQYICAGGCWEVESYCEYGSYCQLADEDSTICVPLPKEYDDYCEPGFEWVDPDCQGCNPCEVYGESFCDRSGLSPDTIIRCEDYTGYGHLCWVYELCSSSGFDNFCVEDLAQNYAACTDFDSSEYFCDQFTCTGAPMCNANDGSAGTGTMCGYCDKCCYSEQGDLCGSVGPNLQDSVILVASEDGFCYEPVHCNSTEEPASNYCRIVEPGQASCETANFFGP